MKNKSKLNIKKKQKSQESSRASSVKTKKLSQKLVEQISSDNSEPDWMREYRINSLKVFENTRISDWGPLSRLPKGANSIDFDKFDYYIRPADQTANKWSEVPTDIREKYDKLGIPEAEKRYLAGVGAQFESQMIYHSLKEDLSAKGIIFEDMNTAVNKYPDLVRKYFGKIITPENNKFAALNGAVWNGGSFVYIPPGVYVGPPLHNFFQMKQRSQGQFERTIIVAETGSDIEFLEGCVAPLYSQTSIHAGVVEIFVKEGASVKFSTMQNWSKNVWNLVTKSAKIEADGSIEWIDANIGSGITMKYPSLSLAGKGAKGRIYTLTFAGKGQDIDAGGKAYHNAPFTESVVESKSILQTGGRSTYRGNVSIRSGANGSRSSVNCVSLMLDGDAISQTIPTIVTDETSSVVDHESSVFRITAEQMLYLQSRGLSNKAARSMIVGGFTDSFSSNLPMEYAVEFDRLIELEIE